jgi:hypothetical protein
MTALINVSAVLLFAFLLFVIVAVALRLLIPSEPYKPATTERSRAGSARRALIEIAGYAVVLASVALAIEIRSAYGSPFGERSLPTVEVVDVGECERAPLGFGISRSCELTSFRSSDPEHHPTQRMDSIEVVTAEPVEPGDLVAQYSASAWTAYAFLGSTDSRWRPVSAEERPNLDWLPTATLIAATILVAALRKRIELAPVKKGVPRSGHCLRSR